MGSCASKPDVLVFCQQIFANFIVMVSFPMIKRTKKPPMPIQELLAFLNKPGVAARLRIKNLETSETQETDVQMVPMTQRGIGSLVTALNSWESLPETLKARYLREANAGFENRAYKLVFKDVGGKVNFDLAPLPGKVQNDMTAHIMVAKVFNLNQTHRLWRVRRCRCGKWFYAGNERRTYHDDRCRSAARTERLKSKE
jgi:hypothetical protein